MKPEPLVDRLRARLEAREWTRVHVFLIVALSAAVSFLCSVVALMLHLHSMAWRYGIAALAGYGTFLVLIHGFVQWKRSQFMPDAGLDLTDLPLPNSIPVPRVSGDAVTHAFSGGGGRSGGGGASGSWGSPKVSASTSGGGKGSGISLDLDGDDLFWLIVAALAAFAGAAAVAYVIYIAPTLIAEAAVNAAVAGHVYRGLQRRESEHWTRDLLKRTGVPAAILVASVTIAGYALHRVAPEAVSIGGVWHHVVRR